MSSAREPQQSRSRATYERILDAAEAEIGELGLAGAGTRGIAARAGVSVGALYRFFPDKDAVADALARRYLDDLTPRYAATLAGAGPGSDLAAVVADLVAAAAALQLSHPGYYRLTEELPPERGDSPAHQVREQVVELFAAALRATGATEPDAEVRRVVGLCVETVRHALVRAPRGAGREDAVADLALMVSSYLRARLEAWVTTSG